METDNVGAPFGLTSNQSSVSKKVSRATWAGLAISLFALVVIRQAFVFFVPETTFASAILKEALIWLNAVALIVIIRRGEHLSLRSIGARHRALVEIHFVGLHHRYRVSSGRRRTGLCHWLRTWSGLFGVRETAAVVDHRNRFPGWDRGRIVLPRISDRTVADDWSRPVLVRRNSSGHLLAWP